MFAEIRDIQGKQLNNCSIELQNQDGKFLDGSDNVPGKFHKVFIITSRKTEYLISILCAGFKTHVTSVTYRDDVTPIKPLKLGIITMEPLIE